MDLSTLTDAQVGALYRIAKRPDKGALPFFRHPRAMIALRCEYRQRIAPMHPHPAVQRIAETLAAARDPSVERMVAAGLPDGHMAIAASLGYYSLVVVARTSHLELSVAARNRPATARAVAEACRLLALPRPLASDITYAPNVRGASPMAVWREPLVPVESA